MAITKETVGKRCLIKSLSRENRVTEVEVKEFSPSGQFVKLTGKQYGVPIWADASEVEIVEILEEEKFNSTVAN